MQCEHSDEAVVTLQEQPVLALIPARGGSKGVPRKNLARIAGKPLLEYTLEAALESKKIDGAYLSSDDADILEVGRRKGVRTIQRPQKYATDDSSAIEVVRHFFEVLDNGEGGSNPLIVYLQPTSPLRNATHIDAALDALRVAGASTLMSVVELDKSPYKSFGLDADGRLKSLFEEKLSNARRQDLPPTFAPNGAIYIFSRADFESRGGFPSNGSIPFVMSARESIDVDVPEDIARVEELLGELNG
jgi:CMP-N-acetylneuraminic acid synthetase